jgi:hypothetical protein
LRKGSVGGISYIRDQYKSERKIETSNGYKSALARRAFSDWFLLTLTDFHSPRAGVISTTAMGTQLVNFITCGCESSAPYFCNLQSRGRTHAVLLTGLYELLGNPTTQLIEPPGPFIIILIFDRANLNGEKKH